MSSSNILSGKELMNINDEPDNYLIEGMLWENNHIMILAKEKVGKSIFSLQMAMALSSGESFLGEYEVPEPMQVLYIQTESTRHETIQRLKSMTSDHGVGWNEDNFFLLTIHSLNLDRQDGLESLISMIRAKNIRPRVIILDPLYMSMEGGLSDEKASRSMSKNIRKLGEIFKSATVTVHHEHRPRMNQEGKYFKEGDNAVMGSFVWKAFPNHIIHLTMKADGKRVLSCSTQRSDRVIKGMELELVQPFPLMYKPTGTTDVPNYVNIVKGVFNNGDELCAKEVIERSGISVSSTKKAISYLCGQKVKFLNKVNPGGRPTYYRKVG